MLALCGIERVARYMRLTASESFDELYALARSKTMLHHNRPLCDYMHTYSCMQLLSVLRLLSLKSCMELLALKACSIT